MRVIDIYRGECVGEEQGLRKQPGRTLICKEWMEGERETLKELKKEKEENSLRSSRHSLRNHGGKNFKEEETVKMSNIAEICSKIKTEKYSLEYIIWSHWWSYEQFWWSSMGGKPNYYILRPLVGSQKLGLENIHCIFCIHCRLLV